MNRLVNELVLSAILVAGVAGAAGCGDAQDSEAPASSAPEPGEEATPPDPDNGLGAYETQLPHTTEAPVSVEERQLIRNYLDAPENPGHATALAQLHLKAAADDGGELRGGQHLAHAILAQYFLARLTDLGAAQPWVSAAQQELGQKLEAALRYSAPLSMEERRPAHLYWRAAFHENQEQNRYQSISDLLDDVLADPNNVYTSFAISANNLWVGSEADRADPTVLYNFALGGYFSVRTIAMAKQVEEAWEADPSHNTRFRMASILGGFSILQRRWLASVHGDTRAVDLLDQEHRQWLEIHPSFHGFTFGLTYFEDPAHFDEGLKALDDSYAFCVDDPGIRTCSDLPRFKFNLLSFQLGYVDFLLRKGDVPAARQLLGFRLQTAIPTNHGISNQVELWNDWTLGRDAWLHREQHADEIAALYRDHPAEAPAHFTMKKKQWGTSTITCQACHQTQARVQTPAEMDEIQLPPESVATVGAWPEIATSWYGSAK